MLPAEGPPTDNAPCYDFFVMTPASFVSDEEKSAPTPRPGVMSRNQASSMSKARSPLSLSSSPSTDELYSEGEDTNTSHTRAPSPFSPPSSDLSYTSVHITPLSTPNHTPTIPNSSVQCSEEGDARHFDDGSPLAQRLISSNEAVFIVTGWKHDPSGQLVPLMDQCEFNALWDATLRSTGPVASDPQPSTAGPYTMRTMPQLPQSSGMVVGENSAGTAENTELIWQQVSCSSPCSFSMR